MAISTPMLVTFCVYIFGMILIGFIGDAANLLI